MKRKAPIILSLIPWALFLLGAALTFAYGAWANARGMWTEGGEWLIFIFYFLPVWAAVTAALAIAALIVNKRTDDRLIVKIVSAVDLVLGISVLLIALLFLIK